MSGFLLGLVEGALGAVAAAAPEQSITGNGRPGGPTLNAKGGPTLTKSGTSWLNPTGGPSGSWLHHG